MPKTPDENTGKRSAEPNNRPALLRNWRSKLHILIPAAAVVVIFLIAYMSGMFKKCLPTGFSVATKGAKSVFSKPHLDYLISQEKLLSFMGAAAEGVNLPTGPGLDSSVSVVERKPPISPPSSSLSSQQGTPQEPSQPDSPVAPKMTTPKSTESASKVTKTPTEAVESPSKPTGVESSRPKAVETPVIIGTKETETSKKKTSGKKSGPCGPGTLEGKAKVKPVHSSEKATAGEKTSKKPEVGGTKETSVGKSIAADDKNQFLLPGSLKVHIQHYSGSLRKWQLMVILDNSASMGRKSKVWSGGKIQTAKAVVEKIAKSLTPGSKLAVRDFMYVKAKNKKAARKPSLSRMIFEWAESPYSGLKEKVKHLDTGGITHPCAATAYSLKKDFAPSDNLTPRIVLITDGASICGYREFARAFAGDKRKGKSGVDVIAVGMGRRHLAGYRKLTKKTDGAMITIDRPADLSGRLSRYAKLLREPVMEEVDIKGENGEPITANLGQTITLYPGSYTVVLPLVAGLHASNRKIPNVRIVSRQARILSVRIRKGKPLFKLLKK
jgi:hypothetical protein